MSITRYMLEARRRSKNQTVKFLNKRRSLVVVYMRLLGQFETFSFFTIRFHKTKSTINILAFSR